MGYVVLIFLLILIIGFFLAERKPKGRKGRTLFDSRGFGNNRIHRNRTNYDDFGYDYYGYNKDGYNCHGYNSVGKNAKGQYNRLFDTTSLDEEGFLNPKYHPVALSTHARERMQERLDICDSRKMNILAMDAYRYGKSKRQIKKTSAYLVEEIEQRYDNSAILIYKNYIYVFTHDNVLKTVYKNERIPL